MTVIITLWTMLRLICIAVLSVTLLTVSVPAQPVPQTTKLCLTFDPNAGHEILLPCPTHQPSKIKRVALRVHHTLRIVGEVSLGAVIIIVWVYANGH